MDVGGHSETHLSPLIFSRDHLISIGPVETKTFYEYLSFVFAHANILLQYIIIPIEFGYIASIFRIIYLNTGSISIGNQIFLLEHNSYIVSP